MPEILEQPTNDYGEGTSPTRSVKRVEMNREFRPKLKAFVRDYQSPYRYASNTSIH